MIERRCAQGLAKLSMFALGLSAAATAYGNEPGPGVGSELSAPALSAPALSAPAPALPPPPPPAKTRRPSNSAERSPAVPLPPTPGEPAASTEGERLHDGFYLRMSMGPVFARNVVQTDRLSQPDVSLRSLGASLELWIGGTLQPGLVVGGLLMGMSGESDAGVVGGEGGNSASFSGSQLGVFLDAYPNPREGYHFGGLLALAGTALETDAASGVAATKYDGRGVGLAVFAGLDAWIGEQWSAGVQLRLGGNLTRDESKLDGVAVEKQGTTYAAAVLGTLVYH